MIFSKDHNFLLLKNGKVGGTALEVELSRVLPDSAIITPATGASAEWKIKDEFYDNYNPRNYDGFWNHMSYSEIKRKINLKNINTYIFVRNPYEIVLSHFFHRLYFINKNLIWNTFDKKEKEELIYNYFENNLGSNWHTSTKHLYIHKEKIVVNDFLHYEKGIDSEINKILTKHNIPNIQVKTITKYFKPKDIKYYDVFSKKYLDIIYNNWEWEFKYFNYEK